MEAAIITFGSLIVVELLIGIAIELDLFILTVRREKRRDAPTPHQSRLEASQFPLEGKPDSESLEEQREKAFADGLSAIQGYDYTTARRAVSRYDGADGDE